ncbi:MAG: cell division protein ZapE [Stellaceae bacterium]
MTARSMPHSPRTSLQHPEALAIVAGPAALYRARIDAGALIRDEAQAVAADKLQALWQGFRQYKPNGARFWWTRLGTGAPRGLYIHGAVGRGKSMLMDMFFASVADAMILGRLFEALFEEGVVVVATSNRAPDTLYQNGLQRERFLPFIDLFKRRLDVLELSGPRDYRLVRLSGRQVYFSPADDNAYRALEHIFADLTGNASAGPQTLELRGRSLTVPRAAGGVAWFDFEALCGAPLGPADYLALAKRYRTFIVEHIPRLGPENRDRARRFNIFIDTLYEAHGRLVASAEAPPAELYTEGDGSFEFQRTVSRLNEMQSAQYIAG